MKPLTSTASPGLQVGAPWEIYRAGNLTSDGRLIEAYTKAGDIGNYHAMAILIPDYDIVMSILFAGNETSGGKVMRIFSETATSLLRALESASRQEAEQTLAGTYQDESSNSTLVLSIDSGPGLVVTNWTIRGVDVPSHYLVYSLQTQAAPSSPISVRLYPTNFKSCTQQSWRAVFDATTSAEKDAQESSVYWAGGSCATWTSMDRLIYQYKSLDELVFTIENKSATSVLPRAFGLQLRKV